MVKRRVQSRRKATKGPARRSSASKMGALPRGTGRRAGSSKRVSPHGLRVAAIDIGSNSLHMVIVEVTDQLSFRILSSEKDLTQLGSEALLEHKLTRRAMMLTTEVLGRYQRIARGLECDVILAYATSAVRECINGGEFVKHVKEQLGLQIEVINAQEEARLIYLAVRQAIDLGVGGADRPVLIVDIGGGSAEFIVGTAERALLLESRKLGASRLTQMFIESDPAGEKELRKLKEHIEEAAVPILEQVKRLRVERVIGTSGTMQNLVAMCHLQHGEGGVRDRLLTEMTRGDFRDVLKRLRKSTLAERIRMPGLDHGRAGQILAGAELVDTVFEELECAAIEVCDRAMREGMIIDYMQTHWPKVRLSVQVRDPRKRSVIELGRRCNFDEKHAMQVTALSLSLFDQLKGMHRLGTGARDLLEHAAMAHDVGWHIGHSGHHKHSYYLIKNGDLEGFSPLELEVIANVARYHRKSPPKKSHEAFMSLAPPERDLVWKLAGLLRIADGMDRGHYGNVKKVKASVKRGKVVFRLLTQGDPELELWGGQNKTDMFEKTFRKRAEFFARQSGG